MSLVPVVASVDELPDAVKYAEQHPSARWYVAKRAGVFGKPEAVPGSWGMALVASTASEDMTTERRQNLAKKGLAMKDGGYPIPDRTFLAKAIKAFGRAKNKAATKRHIIKRAQALHSTDLIPDAWKPLTSAAAVTDDEVGLWVAQVRDLISEAGEDPDSYEAGVAFADDYDEYKDRPQEYVDELIAEHTDDDSDTEETPDEDSEQAPPVADAEPVADAAAPQAVPSLAPAAPVPVAASGVTYPLTTTSTTHPNLVQVFTAPQAAHTTEDRDALLAAVRQVLREEREQAGLAAAVVLDPDGDGDDDTPVIGPDGTAMPGPGDTDQDMGAGPPASADAAPAPDLNAAKDALREKFGKGKRKAKTAPAAASMPMAASAMQERIAAKTAALPRVLTAAAMRDRIAAKAAAGV